MVVRILGQKDTLAYKEAEQVVKEMGLAVWDETYFSSTWPSHRY